MPRLHPTSPTSNQCEQTQSFFLPHPPLLHLCLPPSSPHPSLFRNSYFKTHLHPHSLNHQPPSRQPHRTHHTGSNNVATASNATLSSWNRRRLGLLHRTLHYSRSTIRLSSSDAAVPPPNRAWTVRVHPPRTGTLQLARPACRFSGRFRRRLRSSKPARPPFPRRPNQRIALGRPEGQTGRFAFDWGCAGCVGGSCAVFEQDRVGEWVAGWGGAGWGGGVGDSWGAEVGEER